MTLLETLWASSGDAEEVVERLATGELRLSGNFRGREAEVVEDYRREEA